MDNRPPSIQKPLHGYKKLIRGQVCRLRTKSQQPTRSSSPTSKEHESSDENVPLKETVIKVSCEQWQDEDNVPTRPSIDVRWKGTACENEATRGTTDQDVRWKGTACKNEATRNTTDQDVRWKGTACENEATRDTTDQDVRWKGTACENEATRGTTDQDVRWKGTACENEATRGTTDQDVSWKVTACENEATRDTTDQYGERDNRSMVNCRGQLTETSSIAENSIEEKQERYIRDSLHLDGAGGTRQIIAEKTSQSTGAIRGSRCQPYSNVSNVNRHSSQTKRDGQDGGSHSRAIATGGTLDLRTTQEPGLKNDGSNISVVIDDPLTVDLLLAEQGQLFHTGEAIRTSSNDLQRDANPIDKSRKKVSIVSRTQQVEVAVRNRTITEASITTFSEKVTENRFVYSTSISTETRLVPRSTSTLMEEGRNFRQILDKGKISREKHVRFADEAEHLKLCSTSSTCHQETALPSEVEHHHAYRIGITPHCVDALSRDSKIKEREISGQKDNIHHRQKSRVESVHSNAQESAIIHGNPQDVSNDAVRRDSKPHPDLGNKAFGMDGIEGKAQKNRMPRLPTPRSSADALGSLSLSRRATTFVSPAVKTKQSSLRKSTLPRMSQSAENSRFPPRTDSVSPGERKNKSGITAKSSIEKVLTPFKRRDATSSSVRNVVPPVASRALQSRSEPVTSRRSRREQHPVNPVATPVYTRNKCRNCLGALLRLGLIVLIFVLVVQALAYCLAVGFVTECDSNGALFSPFWGFSWIQFDVTPLASIVRQNLRLVNYKTPPT